MVRVWNYKMGQAIGRAGHSRNFKFDLDVDAVGFLRQGLAWGLGSIEYRNRCSDVMLMCTETRSCVDLSRDLNQGHVIVQEDVM